MKDTPVRVMLVDDDEDDRILIKDYLSEAKQEPFALDLAGDYESALKDMALDRHDVYLVDYRLGAQSGLDLFRQAQQNGSRNPKILLTGQGDRDVDLEAMRLGFSDYLPKAHLNAELLARAIRYALAQKEAFEKLEESGQRYRSLVDLTPDIIYRLDAKGHIEYVNEAVRALGYRPDELRGRPFKDLVRPESFDALRHGYRERRVGERSIREVEVDLVGKKGDVRHVQVSFFDIALGERGLWFVAEDVVARSDKTFLGTQGVARDITDLKRAHADRARIANIAESREHLALLGELAAGIAHEFRNPLHGVLNCVRILRGKVGENPELVQWLDTQEEGLRRMDAIADRLLRLSRHDIGPKVATDVKALAESTLALVRPRAERAGVVLRLEIAPDLPPLPMDAQRIGEALLNLLTNALDACPSGTIRVEARLSPERAGMAELVVTDTGSGIAEEECARVFEPFFTTKPIGKGSGLGLALVKQIAESHDGYVALSSKVGQGTTVRLGLPIKA